MLFGYPSSLALLASHAKQTGARMDDLGIRVDQLMVGGESAGGGLALALLSHLCARDQRPAGVFAYSPFTDPAATVASWSVAAR